MKQDQAAPSMKLMKTIVKNELRIGIEHLNSRPEEKLTARLKQQRKFDCLYFAKLSIYTMQRIGNAEPFLVESAKKSRKSLLNATLRSLWKI